MSDALALPAPGLKPLDVLANSMNVAKPGPTRQAAKARAAAQDFESRGAGEEMRGADGTVRDAQRRTAGKLEITHDPGKTSC